MKPAIYATFSMLAFVGFLAGFIWLGVYMPRVIIAIAVSFATLVLFAMLWKAFYDIYADAKADENDFL